MHAPLFCLTVIAALSLASRASARAVFAHYMVGTVTDEHAHKDIEDAKKMGLDAFALNIGYPQASFVYPALVSLFGYAEYVGFKLFISMDLWAAGDVKHSDGTNVNAFDYEDLLRQFFPSSAYYKGPNGYPFLSTFSDGGMSNDSFNTSHPYWWDYWGPIFEGVSSWENAWVKRNGYGVNIQEMLILINKSSVDHLLDPGPKAMENRKFVPSPPLYEMLRLTMWMYRYMMPLSTLQYKNAYSTNIYRNGNIGLSMENMLKMNPRPDYIQMITWNDGPESHYFGTLWPEQNTDYAPSIYAFDLGWSQNARQPVLASFIKAFKHDGTTKRDMVPHPNFQIRGSSRRDLPEDMHGVLMYKSIMLKTKCPPFATPPEGYDSAHDFLNFTLTIPAGSTGWKIKGGSPAQSFPLQGCLNHGVFTFTEAGHQIVQVYDNTNKNVMTASSRRCIHEDCPDGEWVLNHQTIPFLEGAGDADACLSESFFKNFRILTSQPLELYLEAWIDKNGAQYISDSIRNFLLDNGGENGSQCADLLEEYPSDTCDEYPNPKTIGLPKAVLELYYIQRALHNIHDSLRHMDHDMDAIHMDATVNIKGVVDTFGAKLLTPRCSSNAAEILQKLGTAFGIIGGAAAINPELGGVGSDFSFTGSLFGLAADEDDPETQLQDILEHAVDSLTTASIGFFTAYKSNLEKLPARIFTTGIFRLYPILGGGDELHIHAGGHDQIPQRDGHWDAAQVGGRLRDCGFPQPRDVQVRRLLLGNDNCHALEYSGPSPAVSKNLADISVYSQKLDDAILQNLTDYAVDKSKVIRGSINCQAAKATTTGCQKPCTTQKTRTMLSLNIPSAFGISPSSTSVRSAQPIPAKDTAVRHAMSAG
ncbi:uncharacterized protein BDZ99DRAFT_528212 [Mytilinidion resinicola]|uniref:Glycoside hydrolase n=1 Tax=Mytilinidion resinicola TaxID=574789 RepID=A0A6A6XZQ5_9PEZI|nr:uncharacterized protein BDZ99DRAFT_528212 [Mytilinidion resinicola]KAF2801743.1 hypothetical protein BDZ99DRAFT_528212 [Mytilinidion resinicola]